MEEYREGIGLGGILGIVFIVLKLTGVIAWSWWWVLSPFWIPIVLALAILCVIWVLGKWAESKLKKQ